MKSDRPARGTNDAPSLIMDGRGYIVRWSPAAEEIFGWKRTEAVGRRLSRLIIPERHRSMHEAGLKRFLSSGHGAMLDRPIEFAALHRDGREFAALMRISGEQTRDGWLFSTWVRAIGNLH
jgi:PAS domain S-box-containing protein